MPRDEARTEAVAESPAPGGAPERILIAHDLSVEADRAVALIAATKWPPATVVRIVTSPMDVGETVSSFMGPREARTQARQVAASIEAAHARAVADVARTVDRVESAVLAGPPGDAVVGEATRFGADLVVVGARAHSGLTRMLMGSVSTEISERAPCSVLIARVESLSRVLLATDGSDAARDAESAVLHWPVFADADVRIVGVADPTEDHEILVLSPDGGESPSEGPPASSARAAATMERAVEPFRAAGRRVESQARTGTPAAEVIAAAREWPADVVVVGSIGHSLIRRILVGSEARAILHGVQSSVLLVRRPAR